MELVVLQKKYLILALKNKYTPEEIDDKATQINAVFEKMRKVVDSVSECIRQEADILPLFQSGSELPPKIRVQLENMQRFLTDSKFNIAMLTYFLHNPQFGPIAEQAAELGESVETDSSTWYSIIRVASTIQQLE